MTLSYNVNGVGKTLCCLIVFFLFSFICGGEKFCASPVLFNFSIIMHVARVYYVGKELLYIVDLNPVLWAWTIWFHGYWCLRLKGGFVLATFS